ncbi:MAG: hypothetical protein M1817_003036 [Caeruleum heppii]|nr:MAG: hypothetical protein M1817_003036 [Caeruleum heppii]
MSPAATMALRPGPSKRDSLSPPQTSSLISPAALPPTLNPYEASLHARSLRRPVGTKISQVISGVDKKLSILDLSRHADHSPNIDIIRPPGNQ